ncbi:putative efflux protein, MATE family [Halogranum amylolyticum]|uniref:Multidrug-efflux transporter n=2 Tax=Halogranum amylolyticum TaxID=660520 RepID=A0A1H8QGJ9_9EURY|nr:MATE family efflux transporter [Halogranum amylolyticum]SEO53360.1 putative efflux protein, MATE family [Halogranum amylolyticum]
MRDGRLLGVWKRVFGLAWPVMAEQTFRTLMRTTDILVTATISPVAVAAIGLADLYARFPLWVGLGTGGGAIALSSQDTGSGADANRDQAVSIAILLGALLGVPFVAFGLLFGRDAIALLGAPTAVADVGGLYLGVVFATAPARQVALVAARSLQGTGDTETPMYVNVVANLLNIVGSVVLGLGLLGTAGVELFGVAVTGVVGVGVATAVANVVTALALLAALRSEWTDASLVRPTDPVVAKQLVLVSAPSVAEGLASTLAEFPLNSILLGFGTEVNAGFQIGRRIYQQVTGPLSRGYNVAASIVVGQALGDGDPASARHDGWATVGLGFATVGVVGLLLVVVAEPFVRAFTDDPETARYAVDFARLYGVTATFLVAFTVLQGALRGASETRLPFLARTTGLFGFMVGFTYLVGVVLDYGVVGAYAGIALSYVWMAGVVVVSFWRSDWATRAASMMAERGSASE